MKFTNELKKHYQKYAISVKAGNSSLELRPVIVEQEQEQKFFKQLEQNDLFSLINLVPTAYQDGEALGLVQTMAGATDTNLYERKPKLVTKAGSYYCEQLNLDSYIPYAKLDAFTADPAFEDTLEEFLDAHLLQAILQIGWNGKKRAGTSNPTNYPQGDDVAKGWLQKIRDNATATGKDNVLDVGEIGKNGTYHTLNKAVKAGISKINPIYTDGDLIAICGRDIAGNSPIENNKDGLKGQFITRLQNLVGGCKAVVLPHFPANTILLTRLDNIALYVHRNNIRRGWVDAPQHNALHHFFSFNLDFVVEDFDGCCLLENIELAEE